MKVMIKPQMLNPGDTVAVVSLSSGMAGDSLFYHRAESGMKRLSEEFRLNVKIMPHALTGSDYSTHNPGSRAKDLMDAFRDPQVKAVISMIGGDDTIRLLPYIDFQVLHDNPKIFMGYSDTTINHFMMYKAGLVSFYGPCIMCEFAENGSMHDYTRQYIRQVLFEHHDYLPVPAASRWTSEFLDWADPQNNQIPRTMQSDARGYELLQGEGIVSGTLLGGCADVFPMMAGTLIWPDPEQWNDCILFLETSEEHPSPRSLMYLLRGLAAQGILNRINGIIFGKPKDELYYEEYKQVLTQVVATEAGQPQIPILYNLNFGHTAPICILPYGVRAEINCTERSFALTEAAVCENTSSSTKDLLR